MTGRRAGDARSAPAGGRADVPQHPGPADAEPAADLHSSILTNGGEEYLVLSLPLPDSAELADVTPAERLVLELLLRGRANDEIAALLGRSARTVANQVAAIFRKFGVNSRRELAARLGRWT